MRDLTGPLQATAISDLMQSIFVAEALAPSDPLWILSGWISDIPVIQNSAREFSVIDPDWPTGWVSLIQVFRTILAKGGRIAFILRDVDQNQKFVARLSSLKREFPSQIWWTLGDHEHTKGIVSRNFDLAGSMNFTHRGIRINGEHLIYRADSKTVAGRRLALATQWKGAFDDNL
jgi:hypothetical protein